MPKAGRLRFCGEMCHDGYRTDCRYGVLTLPRDFADQGFCMYCAAYVPTNIERRGGEHTMTHTIHTERGNVTLSAEQFALYSALESDRFRVWTNDELFHRTGMRKRTLDAVAYQLRTKFKDLGLSMVCNVWGVGYRLEDTNERTGAGA